MEFSLDLINELVKTNYGIQGGVHLLDGDVDYNYHIKTNEGNSYLLKICKPEVKEEEVEFQVDLLEFLNKKKLGFSIPAVVRNLKGETHFSLPIDANTYIVRMHTWVDGRLLNAVNPRTSKLYVEWGQVCGELSSQLAGYDHPGAHRFDKWNPTESLYSRKYKAYFVSAEQEQMAEYFWNLFETEVVPVVSQLRHSVNYSDAHEYNLLVDSNTEHPSIRGVIDFGDAIYSATVCELAIACAYAGMHVSDPIDAMCDVVKGYTSKFPLLEEELTILFPLICGRLMITVANAAYNFHIDPENEYHQVSAAPAWDLLQKLRAYSPELAEYHFRSTCGYEAHPNQSLFEQWVEEHKNAWTDPIDLMNRNVVVLDLNIGSLELGNNSNFETVPRFSAQITNILQQKEGDIGIGGYGEIRPFYTTDAYKEEGNHGPQWRTMHLGTDFWVSAQTEVRAFCAGEVISIFDNDNPCDYGPTIILKHLMDDGLVFYSLYGHLSKQSLGQCTVGQKLDKGELIGWVGEEDENGGWPPHLHFQVMLDILGNENDFPGVGYVHDSDVWLSICPNLPNYPFQFVDPQKKIDDLLNRRNRNLGKSLSVSYNDPLHMVRGAGIYLYDTSGRRYIDTVNNVAHVGHEHPRVVSNAQRQIGVLNTNTRYIHENIVKYAEAILKRCPEEMEVVYFVNSGSEANELAMRMAKICTGQKDIIALESGYHGNTGACIDISSYKFDGKGGYGAPEHTSIVKMPDTYRGEFRDPSTAGEQYAEDVSQAIETLVHKGRDVAAFIAESILSCGGQIMLPEGYLKACYDRIHNRGGLCIADEVQVGFGRVGSHFWAFELQGVVPDIITCGKPIGNGHPLAAVITTRAVAEKFTNGMEYFNTFGGNPVSSAIGMEVLKVIEEEQLQENALKIGKILIEGLERLKEKYEIIGDVRGCGLFLGFELVKNRESLEPAAEQATYLANRMREHGVLMSTDGPLHNVIKIKPPMCISIENAEEILSRLEKVFSEDFMQMHS